MHNVVSVKIRFLYSHSTLKSSLDALLTLKSIHWGKRWRSSHWPFVLRFFYLFESKTWACELGAESYQGESKTGISQDKRIWRKQKWMETIRTFGQEANKSFYRHEIEDWGIQDVQDKTVKILKKDHSLIKRWTLKTIKRLCNFSRNILYKFYSQKKWQWRGNSLNHRLRWCVCSWTPRRFTKL